MTVDRLFYEINYFRMAKIFKHKINKCSLRLTRWIEPQCFRWTLLKGKHRDWEWGMLYSIHIRIFCHWILRVDNKKLTIEITMELTDWLFFGGKIQFCLYYMIVWTLILWFPWFIVILGARLKKYLQEVQSNFHVT